MTLEVATTAPRTAPWDKIVNTFPEGTKFKDAMEIAGLDYEVGFAPLYAQTNEGLTPLGSHRATVRKDTDKVIGIVGNRYEIVQNKDALGFLADIVDSGDIVPLGGGYWKGGARPWIQARLPQDIKIAGVASETLVPFIFAATGHDGGLQVTIALSAIRVWCQNTYAANVKAPRRFQIRHLQSITGRVEEARRTLGISFEYFDQYGQLMNQLAQGNLTDDRFRSIVNSLFPLPPESAGETARENVAKKRAEMLGVYLNSASVAPIRGTQYGALQAVTEWYDHVKNGQRQKGSRESIERRSEEILLGDGVKFKDKALALIQGVWVHP